MGGETQPRSRNIATSSPIDCSSKFSPGCNNVSEEVFCFSPGNSDKSSSEHELSSGVYSVSSPSDESLNSSLLKSVAEKDEAIKILEHKIKSLESCKSYLEHEVQQLMDENEMLVKRLEQQKKNEIKENKAGRGRQNSEGCKTLDYRELQTLCDDLSEEISFSKTTIQELRTEKEKLRDDIKNLRDENFDIIKENLQISTAKQEIEKQLGELQAALHDLSTNLETQDSEINLLRTNLEDKTAETSKLKTAFLEIIRENEYLKQRSLDIELKIPTEDYNYVDVTSDKENIASVFEELNQRARQMTLEEARQRIQKIKVDFAKCQNNLGEEAQMLKIVEEKVSNSEIEAIARLVTPRREKNTVVPRRRLTEVKQEGATGDYKASDSAKEQDLTTSTLRDDGEGGGHLSCFQGEKCGCQKKVRPFDSRQVRAPPLFQAGKAKNAELKSKEQLVSDARILPATIHTILANSHRIKYKHSI